MMFMHHLGNFAPRQQDRCLCRVHKVGTNFFREHDVDSDGATAPFFVFVSNVLLYEVILFFFFFFRLIAFKKKMCPVTIEEACVTLITLEGAHWEATRGGLVAIERVYLLLIRSPILHTK